MHNGAFRVRWHLVMRLGRILAQEVEGAGNLILST